MDGEAGAEEWNDIEIAYKVLIIIRSLFGGYHWRVDELM